MEQEFAHLSQVTPYGVNDGSHCGYCDGKRRGRKRTAGMRSKKMSVLDYEAIMEYGWRRSGTYFYRPQNDTTCCPQIPIRLKASEFTPTRSQRRVLLRMGASEGSKPKPKSKKPSTLPPSVATCLEAVQEAVQRAVDAVEEGGAKLSVSWRNGKAQTNLGFVTTSTDAILEALTTAQPDWTIEQRPPGFVDIAPTTIPAFASAKEIDDVRNWAKKEAKKRAKKEEGREEGGGGGGGEGGGVASSSPVSASSSSSSSSASSSSTSSSSSSSTSSSSSSSSSTSPSTSPSSSSSSSSSAGVRLILRMVPGVFAEDSYALYRRYQMAVHGDSAEDASREQYRRFLCDSPLVPVGARGAFDERGRALPLPSAAEWEGAAWLETVGVGQGPREERAAMLKLVKHFGLTPRVAQTALRASFGDEKEAVLRCVAANGGKEVPRVTAGSEAEAAIAATIAAQNPTVAKVAHRIHTQRTLWGRKEVAVTGAGHRGGGGEGGGGEEGGGEGGGGEGEGGGGEEEKEVGEYAWLDRREDGSDMRFGFGSFHMRYELDGVLVAVGVVDVLPQYLSSVYVFYDPEVAKRVPLGKLSALLEIEWVQRASRVVPSLQYWLAGFYVHSCHKMRYKADYKPSQLRCPVTQTWVPYERAKAFQESNPNAALLPPAEARDIARRKHQEAREAIRDSPSQALVFLEKSKALLPVDALASPGKERVEADVKTLAEQTTPEIAQRFILTF